MIMMKIGNTTIHIVSDGIMRIDGGGLFGAVPKTDWEHFKKPDRRNRVKVNLNGIVIETPESNLLIGAGVGNKRLAEMAADYGFTRSRLPGALKEIGLNPRNVNMVALPNLKFDYSGGGTKHDRDSVPVPTFRNAAYLMQKDALAAAKAPSYRYRHAYYEADFGPLEEQEKVKFVEDGETIIPGVSVKTMDSVAGGNQVFYIQFGSERLMFVGDVIPTRYHLTLDCIQADVEHPNKLIEQKRYLIDQAVQEGWLMVFGKDPDYPAVDLEVRDGELKAKPRKPRGI